jgi:hypothetical protein
MHRTLPALLLSAACGIASATTFNVNNVTDDLPDASPGDGTCHVAGGASGSDCTLRAAVMEANAHGGTDTIIVPANTHIVLSLAGRGEDAAATGDLDINGPLVISTPFVPNIARTTIDANGIDRVFDVVGAGDVELNNLVITGGRADNAASTSGGAIQAAGAGTLTIAHCELTGNLANAGGAIFVNTGLGRALMVSGSYLHDNTASDLGYVNPFGSAIKDNDSGSTTTGITVRGSTISDNPSPIPGSGAAVYVRSPLTVENTTFDGNLPGALYLYNANASLDHVTISDSQYGYMFSSYAHDRTSTLRNTIIAGNIYNDCQFGSGGDTYDHSYSLDDDGSCQLGAPGIGNLPSTDPMLKPLALRHGDRPIRDLATGSPAIDAGDPTMDGSGGSCLGTDEDGTTRPIDGDGDGTARCDMGAVEYEDDIFANGFESVPIIL